MPGSRQRKTQTGSLKPVETSRMPRGSLGLAFRNTETAVQLALKAPKKKGADANCARRPLWLEKPGINLASGLRASCLGQALAPASSEAY